MNPAADRRAIPVYLLVTWTVSSLFYFLIIKSAGHQCREAEPTPGLMWCPAIGALLTCKYLSRPIASLGWQWGQTRYQVLSYLIPLGYSTFTYSIAWLTGIAALNPMQSGDAFSRFLGLGPLSETFRHRALFPGGRDHRSNPKLRHDSGRRDRLAWIPRARVSQTLFFFVHGNRLCFGPIWALWHVPIIVFAGYNAGTGWYGLAVVSANMIGLCFVLTWLRLKSGSLWTA